MFAAHPAVFVPRRETYTFLNAEEAYDNYRRLAAEWLRSGKDHLAEKTPKHIHCLSTIRRVAPEARIVIPVRDGRDVAASLAVRFGDRGEAGVARWIDETGIALAQVGRPDAFVYRHEDLVSDPVTVLARICAFSGVPFAPEMLDFHKAKRLWFGQTEIRRGTGSNGAEHRALRNWQLNQPLFDSRGRWRNSLDVGDVGQLLTGEGRRVMMAFGYLEP